MPKWKSIVVSVCFGPTSCPARDGGTWRHMGAPHLGAPHFSP